MVRVHWQADGQPTEQTKDFEDAVYARFFVQDAYKAAILLGRTFVVTPYMEELE